MRVVAFNLEHLEWLQLWLRENGAYPPALTHLPEISAVAEIKGIPTAMGFIRKVEGGYGIVDGLASNPMQSAQDRDDALNAVLESLMDTADGQGMILMAWVKDKNTLMRSERHGFKPLPGVTLIIRA